MATSYIIASGKIAAGIMTMNIALAPITSQERTEILLARLAQGRELYEAGFTRYACRNQDEEAGYDAAAGMPTADGWLQHEIDYAAETEEYEDYMEDIAFWRKGGW